jgi:hypothetical protein
MIIFSSAVLLFSNNFQNKDVKLNFNGNNAYTHVEKQLDIGFRIPGSDENNECIDYFISEFKEINANFTFILHTFEIHSTFCQNALFKLNENEKDIIILAAHYDSRAKATKERSDKPVPGANDGASGCAVLIELARVLYKQKNHLECQIWFVFLDAEDQGKDEGGYGIDEWDWCEGSKEFVDDINYFYEPETQDFECMILLDMVGGVNLQFINEEYSTSSLLEELFQIGRELGYTNEFPIFPISSAVFDDHLPFLEMEIPTADLIINFWENPTWPHHHTTEDNLSHISQKSLSITGKTIEQFVYNNYLNNKDDTYRGNSPWKDDSNIPTIQITFFIIILISILAMCTICYYFYRLHFKK